MVPYILFLLQALQTPAAPAHMAGPVVVEREAWVMGTRLRMMLEGARAEAASEQVLREIERLERLLSTWDPASAIAEVNSAPPRQRITVSAELASILAEAESWAARTARAFDPTIGTLIDAWGVRTGGRTPSPDVIADALAATGAQAFTVDAKSGTLTRQVDRAWIDTGAFGKGYALRAVQRTLAEHGVTRALVDLGGQLLALADPSAPWLVEVAHPASRGTPVLQLRLAGVSVATSGDSERPGHLLDPRTGQSAPAWGSVTVVAGDAMEADVLATALFVMGPDAALAWARAHTDAGVLLLRTEGTSLRAAWTRAMEPWLGASPSGFVTLPSPTISQDD